MLGAMGVCVASAEAANMFDTVGITNTANRANSQINGNPPYSLPAEQMPASNSIVVNSPQDTQDDVPFRMPDTSGVKPNFAGFRGQSLTLKADIQKPYTRIHFFGTTADGSGGGDVTLRFADGRTQLVNVQFPDWCGNPPTAANRHLAIGRMTGRYRSNGSMDTAPCSVFHVWFDITVADSPLVSVTLPSQTNTGAGATTAYLMALTLQAGTTYEMPDLTTKDQFPNDDFAPQSTATLSSDASSGAGWYGGPIRVTLSSEDEAGGSGVHRISYRLNGGNPQVYNGPFMFSTEGLTTLEYRAVDGVGNAEPYKSIPLRIDTRAPVTTPITGPERPLGENGWFDDEVEVRFSGADNAGSGVGVTEYRLSDAEAWKPVEDFVLLEDSGVHELQYRSRDVAGNQEAGQSMQLKVDPAPPTTGLLVNGAAPKASYFGPAVRLTLTGDDGAGAGVEGSEYRVDGGEWEPYTGAFDVSGTGGHRIDYRSWDVLGNVENYRTVLFAIDPASPLAVPAPLPIPQAGSTPRALPFVALEPVAAKKATRSALRRKGLAVRISCQSVERGTVSLTVSRAVAKRLGLKRTTLARRSVSCGNEGRATVTLRPSAAVRRALARSKSRVAATLRVRMPGVASDRERLTLR
jgi:hypothetical protein